MSAIPALAPRLRRVRSSTATDVGVARGAGGQRTWLCGDSALRLCANCNSSTATRRVGLFYRAGGLLTLMCAVHMCTLPWGAYAKRQREEATRALVSSVRR